MPFRASEKKEKKKKRKKSLINIDQALGLEVGLYHAKTESVMLKTLNFWSMEG